MKQLFILIILLLPTISSAEMLEQAQQEAPKQEIAIFAGGCFWCIEEPYDKMNGVLSTVSGYTNGHVDNPTYQQVSGGSSGHIEVLRVIYEPEKISYQTLLDIFWRNIDPLDDKGQFCDKGEQYTSAIFYQNDEQQQIAEQSKIEITKILGTQAVTPILAGAKFYPAEDYHQNYYSRNPIRYKYYRYRCGRDKRLEELWGDK